jgi:probable HAF family extracellular repeat protein
MGFSDNSAADWAECPSVPHPLSARAVGFGPSLFQSTVNLPSEINIMKSFRFLLLLSCCALIGSLATAQTRFTVTDLGTCQGYPLSPRALNDNGDVVGDYLIQPQSTATAFLYHNGQMQSLGALGAWQAHPTGMNNDGKIVGELENGNGTCNAFRYFNGTTTVFPTLGGQTAAAFDINASGDFVGDSLLSDNVTHRAFVYRGGSPMTLGTLAGHSLARVINDQGVIAGSSYDSQGKEHLVMYDANNQLHDLGVPKDYVFVEGINNHSQIIGYSADGGFLHDGNQFIPLGSLSGIYCTPMGINDSGWVVGNSPVSVPSTYGQHAFLYEGGSMYDLNSLLVSAPGVELFDAVDVNNAGQIVASGVGNKTYLLTPVPEPATLGLLVFAVVGAAFWRRKDVRRLICRE